MTHAPRLFDPEGEAEAKRLDTLRNAWAGYLYRYPWTHVAVLTPRFEVSIDRVLSECAKYSRRLEKMAQGRVPFFAAAEGGSNSWPHVHALIGGTGMLTIGQLHRVWTLGQSRICLYRGSAKTIGYALKRLGEGPDAGERSAFKLPREFLHWP